MNRAWLLCTAALCAAGCSAPPAPGPPAEPPATERPAPDSVPQGPRVPSVSLNTATTLKEALAEARKTRGYVVVRFTTSYSVPCELMVREAFEDEGFLQLLHQAVLLKIDSETVAGKQIAKDYGMDTVPQLAFLRPDGHAFAFVVGYVDVPTLSSKVKKALTKR